MGDYDVQLKIKQLAQSYLQIDELERGAEDSLPIFNALNTMETGTSKDILDSSDSIDKYFKDIMGLNVEGGNDKIDKALFNKKIDSWAKRFAEYETPKPKKKPKAKTPITPTSSAVATGLARNLVKHIQPSAGNNWWGDVWGDDDDRATDSFAMFGLCNNTKGNPEPSIIDANNIVEVFDKIDLKEFRKSCNMLDDADETAMVNLVVACFRDRIELLENPANGIKVPKEVKNALDAVESSVGDYGANFSDNISICIKALRGLGVADQESAAEK